MRVFLTGATGYIGGEVAKALRRSAFEVAALVRPDSEQRQLRDLGVVLVSGDLHSLPSVPLDGYDAFIHTAAAATDRAGADAIAVDAFTAARKPFVYTSGVWVLGNTDRADEASAVNPLSLVSWRPAHEERVLGSGGAVLRPGCVYGGKQGLFADWFVAAEQNRPLQIVGDGTQRWAMVDLQELVDLYVLAIAQNARGVLHGIDDSHDSLEDCARAVAPGGAVEKIPLEIARTAMGPFADALAVDQIISSTETRQKLGWMPKRTFVSAVKEQWAEWRETRAATR
jgi:nucleoside-diphosphate-sugar epimerase